MCLSSLKPAYARNWLPPSLHPITLVCELGRAGELCRDLPNMLEVWLRLCVAVNKPRKTSSRGECAGLRLPLPLKPKVLSHSAYVVSGGLRVAATIVWAELTKRYHHLESLDKSWTIMVINLQQRGNSWAKLCLRLRSHHSSQDVHPSHHRASRGHQ